MPSKRRQPGQRILSGREAKQWDEDRIKRFEEEQRRKHEWIKFAEIAEEYSERGGPAGPKKAAAAREHAYTMLVQDLMAGYFEQGGRSRVRFVFPGVSGTHGKMTRKWLQDVIDNNWDDRRGRSYLENCWLPRKLYERWCERHHLPKSPQRFQPSQDSRPRVSVAERSEPNMRPSEPQKPSNRGGRPQAVDWEALKDAFREVITIHDHPDPRNPPGWRGTKDAVEFAVRRLGKEGGNVSHRTIEDCAN